MGGGFGRSIFEHIVSVENLFVAWRVFKKGKNNKPDVINFLLNLENNIFQLREELLNGKWICGGYKKFVVKDPKLRTIHKATVRDRILYQAVYQILYPIFDKTFIFDSYSSRVGKGTHAGIKRLNICLRKLSRNYTKPVYALKCDIKKFFDSIDHKILLDFLKEKVNCPETLELLKKIICSFNKIPDRGLPLGNVTSQIFANIYLNSFDWCMKNDLKIEYYIRYNDDFIILSTDKNYLNKLIRYITCFLCVELKLELHPDKVMIKKFHQGIDFLGAVSLPCRMVPRTKTKRRIIKKSQRLLRDLQNGKITKERFSQSIASYLGHLGHTKSRETRRTLHSMRAKMRDLPQRT